MRDLCVVCQQALPRVPRPCARCALPLPAKASECGSCLVRPPPFRLCLAPLVYATPVDRLVADFKYQGQLATGRVLAELTADALVDFYQSHSRMDRKSCAHPLPDLIVPVPLHRRRLQRRGFNQALELSRVLSRRLSVPLQGGLLARPRATPSQQGLSAAGRRRNLRGAFRLARPQPLKAGPVVALVDDVVTTGSTSTELSRLLLDGGASEVHVWAVARTL